MIDEMRYFLRYGLYEEAVEVGKKTDIDKLDLKEKIQFYKLMALSYRKLELQDCALIYISKAISIITEQKKLDDSLERELAICFMNKGVIYDSQKDYDKACEIYLQAIRIFRKIEPLEKNILINALINYAEALVNGGKERKARFIYEETLSYIEDNEDIRKNYIEEKLTKL